MVKVKSKGKKKSTLSAVKKNAIKKKVMNPFEVHINHQKHEVLGRKAKTDRGLPGVARAKAMKKRKVTLLHEYRVKDKSNKFMDRRIGEKNRAMTGEDRIMARFTAERMKSHNKKSMFNLADDEVLTHHGQTLTELEKFDDPRSEDEDEQDEGKLDASFVKEAHFGGGIFTKSGDPQSRKDLIEQLIAESKKRKADQKKNRQQTQELTDKLDTEWKDLLPIIATSKRKPGQDEGPREPVDRPDEYDTMMMELKFEARGRPSDRLKSEEEIAKEERERLEKLEADRLQRMHGITEKTPKITHRSADDLDDGFDFDSADDDQTVSYDVDGKLKTSKTDDVDSSDNDEEPQKSDDGDSVDDEEEDDDDDDDDEDSADDEDNDDLSDLKSDSEEEKEITPPENIKKDSKNVSRLETELLVEVHSESAQVKEIVPILKSGSEEENEAKRLKKMKRLSKNDSKVDSPSKRTSSELAKTKDVEDDAEEEQDDEPPQKVKKLSTKKAKKAVETAKESSPQVESNAESDVEEDVSVDKVKHSKKSKCGKKTASEEDMDVPLEKPEVDVEKKLLDVENFKKDLMARKLIMDTARKELPYTFKVPETYEALQKLLEDRNPEYQAVILERIIKCNHPSLADGNKDKLATLLAFLLQHLHDMATQDDGECFVVLDRLAPHFYDLAVLSTVNARRCVSEVLKEKQHDYRKQRKLFPAQDTLVFLKLISLLFPTSDFRHPVVTPAFVFISQLLNKCQTKTRRDVAAGLFLSTMLLEYTVLSKRFSPEVITYLTGLLRSATLEKSGSDVLRISPGYTSSLETPMLSLKELSSETELDDDFRCRALSQAVKLLHEFMGNLSDMPAAYPVFQPIAAIKCNKFPIAVRKQVEDLQAKVNLIAARKMIRIVPEAKKPKVLKLYEPAIAKVYDGKTHRVMGKERKEQAKLLHKLKRETKGAIREIRRDGTFIAKLRIKETRRSDMERKAKVKEIYGTAACQQGELNKMKRKKK